MPTIDDALAAALQMQRVGHLAESEQICRRILQAAPSQASAWHCLGLIEKQRGQHEAAIALIARALELRPDFAEAHNDQGNCLFERRQYDEAQACYQRAIALKPELAVAHYNLGNVFQSRQQWSEAAAHYVRALEIDRFFAAAYYGLASALMHLDKIGDAADQYRLAILLKPDWAQAHCNLALCLTKLGQLHEAMASFQEALRLQPNLAAAHHNLAAACFSAGRFEQAVDHFEQALSIHPDAAESHVGLGGALQMSGHMDRAMASYRRALQLNPACVDAHNNLGNALKDQGLLDDAIESYRRAIELTPGHSSACSNYLYALHFSSRWEADAIYQEHRRWNSQFGESLAASSSPHANDRTRDRRMRVGYVSPDFRNHCQSFFTTPLFRHHHPNEVELRCYSDVACPDETTERLRCLAASFRSIAGMTDEAVSQLIRQDQIDILVDLTMHMDRGRPLLFARRPSPVQVAWLAYPGTTGLTSIDYRLTDPYLDPRNNHEPVYSEKPIWLPDTFWCYEPLGMAPAVSELPADMDGRITFGCFNNFCKVNAEVIELWAQILRSVERSRLLLLAPAGSCRDRTLETFERAGVSREQVLFVSRQPLSQYFELYHSIDISLDTFPYNGHTTSLDSLYMGVPVITLVGKTAMGRAGLSQLSNLGLTELVARSREEFVTIAVELAASVDRLRKLRRTLRNRMVDSPLMDGERFATNVEAAYRNMWRQWCDS